VTREQPSPSLKAARAGEGTGMVYGWPSSTRSLMVGLFGKMAVALLRIAA